MKMQNTYQKGVGIMLLLVQLFDIGVHAATDQLEPLRVASNLIIIAWLAVMASGRSSRRTVPTAFVSIGAYLGLNMIFLALEGLTNPNTGELRGMLFLLVILTTALSTALYFQMKNSPIRKQP